MARACRGQTGPLLGGVFVVASLITAVLSLDATVVLLTPVVLATAARVGARPRPYVYACAHLANSASLLLPVSNLTNLLAFTASGLSFTRFAALMALPWLAAIAVEYAVFRRAFRADLAAGAHAPDPEAERTPVPVFTLVVLGLTLAGFVVTSFAGAEPLWAALAGAAVLAVRALAKRETTPAAVVRSANPLFCLFVLALGVVVKAVVDNGLGDGIAALLPDGDTLPALLGVAVVAALLANLDQQPARDPRPAPDRRGGRSRTAARRPDRGEHRPQPHLRRVPRHAPVAPHPARPRGRPRAGPLHAAGTRDRTGDAPGLDARALGIAAPHRGVGRRLDFSSDLLDVHHRAVRSPSRRHLPQLASRL
ncbi:hypothetical protein SMICM304S_10252 [Streptomyces microflavus]